ncbi:MAG: acetyl-CoA carboxylase biotin carboxyl carrier protein [Bdellovibrionales bacterium]|nr:acetyl-CoA carboxylase biotin carboxyl carrier protein [Bdellovibrionales bacterium]
MPATRTKSTPAMLPLADWKAVFELMGQHQMAELEWESSGFKLRVRSGKWAQAAGSHAVMHPMTTALAPTTMASSATLVSSAPSPSGSTAASSALSANQKKILSPFVGTFYRKSSPDAAPYVSEGQSVKPGDTLCIIEAMKLMNEIEAEFAGKIVSILVENGQPVEFGEPLFIIET